MSIIRVEKNKNYSVINNTGLNDCNLSFKAKGILAYLLSKPDNWKCIPKDLAANSCDGQKAIYSGLKELRAHGYMIKRPIRNSSNVIVAWEEVLYETPQEEAKTIYREQKARRLKKQLAVSSTFTKGQSGQAPFSQKPYMGNGKILINRNIRNTKAKEEKTTPKAVHSSIVAAYKNCISKIMSKEEEQMLLSLQEKAEPDIINKAITLAASHNARNINYVSTVIWDWIDKGLTTLSQVELYLAKWAVKNKQAKENRERQINKKAEEKDYNKKAPLTNFADYEQREYDYDKLERQLLGWE